MASRSAMTVTRFASPANRSNTSVLLALGLAPRGVLLGGLTGEVLG
jgi:hypothetical protein